MVLVSDQRCSQAIAKMKFEIEKEKKQAKFTSDIKEFLREDDFGQRRKQNTHAPNHPQRYFSSKVCDQQGPRKLTPLPTLDPCTGNSIGGDSCHRHIHTRTSRRIFDKKQQLKSSQFQRVPMIHQNDKNNSYQESVFGRSRTDELRKADLTKYVYDVNASVIKGHKVMKNKQCAGSNLELRQEREKQGKVDQIEDEKIIVKEREVLRLCRNENWSDLQAWLDDNSSLSVERVILRSSALDPKKEIKPQNATILHVMCSKKTVPFYLVHRIIAIAPESCRIFDAAGRLPMHHAILSSADSRITKLLALSFPDSLKIPDKSGLVPFLSRSKCFENGEGKPKLSSSFMESI